MIRPVSTVSIAIAPAAPGPRTCGTSSRMTAIAPVACTLMNTDPVANAPASVPTRYALRPNSGFTPASTPAASPSGTLSTPRVRPALRSAPTVRRVPKRRRYARRGVGMLTSAARAAYQLDGGEDEQHDDEGGDDSGQAGWTVEEQHEHPDPYGGHDDRRVPALDVPAGLPSAQAAPVRRGPDRVEAAVGGLTNRPGVRAASREPRSECDEEIQHDERQDGRRDQRGEMVEEQRGSLRRHDRRADGPDEEQPADAQAPGKRREGERESHSCPGQRTSAVATQGDAADEHAE